jgi:copper oxidase (laccase) domain-containing protein
VKNKNIEILRRCTVCENDVFFSYRGGKKKTGHMGAVICLK